MLKKWNTCWRNGGCWLNKNVIHVSLIDKLFDKKIWYRHFLIKKWKILTSFMAEQRANEWAGKARGILKLSEVFRWVSSGKCSLEMKICRGAPWRKDPHPYSWRMAIVNITDVRDISKQISEPDKIHNIFDLDPVLLKYSFAFFTCSGMKVWKLTDSGQNTVLLLEKSRVFFEMNSQYWNIISVLVIL